MGSTIYPLRLEPFPSLEMATPWYPLLTPSEGLLNIVGDLQLAGYTLEGGVADAQMLNRLGMRSLNWMEVPLPFLARIRSNTKVFYGQERLSIKHLADRFRPGKARYYQRLGWYAKKLWVFLPGVGHLHLLLIWKAQGYDFQLMTELKPLLA